MIMIGSVEKPKVCFPLNSTNFTTYKGRVIVYCFNISYPASIELNQALSSPAVPAWTASACNIFSSASLKPFSTWNIFEEFKLFYRIVDLLSWKKLDWISVSEDGIFRKKNVGFCVRIKIFHKFEITALICIHSWKAWGLNFNVSTVNDLDKTYVNNLWTLLIQKWINNWILKHFTMLNKF